MDNQLTLPRTILIYSVCAGLALVLGYLLADPFKYTTVGLVGLVLLVLSLPVLMRQYHFLLVLSWNANIVVFFLPGQPNVLMVMAAIGTSIALFDRALVQKVRFKYDPWVAGTLVFVVIVVVVTAYLSGGIGVRSLGSESYGGKKYLYILGAVMGYFALVSRPIKPERAEFYSMVYLLTALTMVLSYLIYFAGPSFYFLFAIFPPELMALQSLEWAAPGQAEMVRFGGVASAATAICSFLQLKFGLRGLFDLRRPWRMFLYAFCVIMSLFGGFRSVLIFIAMMFAVQFYVEGLHKSRLLPILVMTSVLALSVSLPFVDRMPLSVQRTLSFLPIEIDPLARQDAEYSTQWRLDMWKRLVPEIPKYFWVGKGYSIDPTDLYFAHEGVRRGVTKNFEPALIAGDYHSGPLSILIAFGIFGTLGFLAFFIAGWWVLYRNYRHGSAQLRNVNAFFLSFYMAHVLFFFTIYGSISSDLFVFTGILGLSASINAGIKQPASKALTAAEAAKTVPALESMA